MQYSAAAFVCLLGLMCVPDALCLIAHDNDADRVNRAGMMIFAAAHEQIATPYTGGIAGQLLARDHSGAPIRSDHKPLFALYRCLPGDGRAD